MKNEIIQRIEEEKIIAIVRGVEREKLIPLVEALYDGGIRLAEITFSSNGKISDEETAENIKMLSEHFAGRMYIGAGTVLYEKQVKLAHGAGALFIISPDASESVIKATLECGMVSIPGALTPREIQIANNAGADFVKLFPISNFGAEYVKAVSAPLSHVKLLAVGGMKPENMGEYLRAGACGFGIGSNIVDKKMLANNDFDGIKELAKKYTQGIKEWQNI